MLCTCSQPLLALPGPKPIQWRVRYRRELTEEPRRRLPEVTLKRHKRPGVAAAQNRPPKIHEPLRLHVWHRSGAPCELTNKNPPPCGTTAAGSIRSSSDGTARQTGKTHIASPTIPARPPRKLRRVLPFKSTILRSFLSAESFFFRNEQFFIVMSWCVV